MFSNQYILENTVTFVPVLYIVNTKLSPYDNIILYYDKSMTSNVSDTTNNYNINYEVSGTV
jgi:hypothetical protein